jgi:RNA polymerase sigma-70 factor (ECF subfamily)
VSTAGITPDAPQAPAFDRHRTRLFGLAYRMLGSIHDAEDVVQDAFLRWQQADAEALRAPEGWLVAVTTRLAIDRLRRAETERKAYVGDWLPEPLPTATYTALAADVAVERASDLSVAFLLLLERLAPEERAAFLLRELFDRGYDEIATILGRTAAATRQVVHRARERLRAEGRGRFDVPLATQQQLVGRFLAALTADDEAGLLALLAPDVRLVSDSGGKVSAARKTLRGATKVIRFLVGIQRRWSALRTHRLASVNGALAVVTMSGDRVFAITSFETDGARVLALYRTLNPDKLRAAEGLATSARSA